MPTPFTRTTQVLEAATGRGAHWAWALAGVLLSAWAGWFVFGRLSVLEPSRRARLEVQQAAHPVPALQAGRIVATHLTMGRAVRAGDVLLEIDAAAVRLRLQEEQARIVSLTARRQLLQHEIAAIESVRGSEAQAAEAAQQAAQARAVEAAAQADFANEHERRVAREHAAGNVPEIDALRAAAEARRLQAAREALVADRRRLVQDAATRSAQAAARTDALRGALAALDAEAQAAASTLARTQLDIDRHRVLAPVAGVVADIELLAPGGHVTEGQRVATVVPAGTLRVVAEFDPVGALGRLRPGQTASVRLDGFPWLQYGGLQARVHHVASEVREKGLRVELELLSDAASAGIPAQHGLSAQVEVMLESVSPALLLWRTMGRAMPAATPPAPTTAALR